MNKFVDFGKRSVDLPAGCKDLIDVLQQPSNAKRQPFTTTLVRLADVATHVDGLAEAGAKAELLAITWNMVDSVVLTKERGVISAIIVIHENKPREQAVLAVFEEAGLAPNFAKTVQDSPDSSARVLRYSFPPGASNIGNLISELLRRGYGLAENVSLQVASWKDRSP